MCPSTYQVSGSGYTDVQDLFDVLVCACCTQGVPAGELVVTTSPEEAGFVFICWWVLVSCLLKYVRPCYVLLLFTICCIANQDALTAIADTNVCRRQTYAAGEVYYML